MKNPAKKISLKDTSKINSTISIDKKLDKIKNVNFVSNKIEEVNKIVKDFNLSF
ncbi:hypothetical protein [Flavobacterium sp. FlaQc-47]|jgi:hypothetical protein|uniref:hypothetical protein n=1 Tax=Flavobacterium sp. FlaQc-47 TaxID=3374180 RepID=UPI003756EDDA